MTTGDDGRRSGRIAVRKTYKLWIGAAFVRSESGRYDHASRGDAGPANIPRASRKDVRDAVKAARAAADGWAKRTAYNRGQILYRFAEALAHYDTRRYGRSPAGPPSRPKPLSL